MVEDEEELGGTTRAANLRALERTLGMKSSLSPTHILHYHILIFSLFLLFFLFSVCSTELRGGR